MSDADLCPAPRRRRAVVFPAAFAAVVSLLASLLALTGARPAVAAEAAECAPLALAPFGDPGDAVGEVTVPARDSACFTVTAPQPGLYLVSLTDSRHNTYPYLYAADGTQLDCHDERSGQSGWCQVPEAGSYTLSLVNDDWVDPAQVRVTVVPLGSATPGCHEAVGTRWDQPTVSRTSVSPLAVGCQAFDAEPGRRVLLGEGTRVYGETLAWITDASGAWICPRAADDEDTFSCVLPGEGPYRVLSQVRYAENGFPAEYAVKVRPLTDPQGCRTAAVRPYGPLQGLDFRDNPCFTFTVGSAGAHLVHAVGEESAHPVRVFDAAGKIACREVDPCRLTAAGTYTAILEGTYPFRTGADDLVVLDRASDAGCVPAGAGVHRGELRTVGQYDCLTLDAPQGARIAALIPLSSSGADADVEVLDRAGTPQCDASRLAGGDCALTGTAPYRALVHADSDGRGATGPYAIAFHRTDVAQDCPVLPAGSFAADGAKATLTTGDGVFSHCLSIPAGAHTDAEVLQLIATAGGVSAQFSVLDTDGTKVCEVYPTTHGWTLCRLTPGKAHTVLFTGRDAPATYTLARRDVTASAASAGCARTTAAKVGGPSVAGSYGAPGTLNCHQVTTAAADDVLHIDVRDPLGTANSMVLGGDGTVECSFRNRSCAATGSTTHQVLVQTPARLSAAPAYRLDALRVATASGPAPECTRVPSVAYGYGPVTGTLDESRTAVCAVLPTAAYDSFEARITDTTGATATAVPALYSSSWNDGCALYIPSGYRCSASGPASSLFVLGLPEKASRTAYRAELVCTSAPCGPDNVNVTGLSPTTGASGNKVKVTVTGTALPSDARVRLYRGGRTVTATADSVSADRRTLTATLDLTGAEVGAWSVSVFAGCCEFSRGTFTVTEPQLRNTVAPKVTGTVEVGARVTAAPGSWSATPTSYTYQWKADGRAIAGATAKTYAVPAGLLGKKLSVTVTAVKSGWQSGTATSAAVTVAKGDAPRATTLPVITGTPKVGQTLRASKGTWSPAPTSYAYQWYASGRAISGATRSSLVLTSAQRGKTITVKVIARRTGHKDGSALSRATAVVR
ncbi:Tat pathway signal protein [Streptomyces sp. enrichment culture]|uniref:Tat pathway signal protein n=1 Tax=Streptomyces sp. enrichment culture TaxID=1795815 RepID=UPI003F5547FA